MLPTYLIVILLAFLSGFTTLIGVALALKFRKSIKGVVAGLGFAAGIMLLISFLEIIPEAIELTNFNITILTVFLGILFFTVLDYILPHTHLIKEKGRLQCRLMKMACLVAFGLIIHDFPEGFAMANAYLVAPNLGIFVAISIALHNIPEEFAIAIPLVLTKKKRFLVGVAILSGLAEPLGAVIGLVAASFFPALIPYFLAFAAGAMIFISLHELIPMAKQYKRINFLVLGIVLSIATYWLLHLFLPEA